MPSPIPVILSKDGEQKQFPSQQAAEHFLGIYGSGSMVAYYLKNNQKLRGYKITTTK